MKSLTQKAIKKQLKKQEAEEKVKAKKKQYVVVYAISHGKSKSSAHYKEPISNIKRWCKAYDGTWKSLLPKSRQPHSHPNQHTIFEEADIIERWGVHGKKGIDYAYCKLVRKKSYKRSYGGFIHALRRLSLLEPRKSKGRRNYRQCTACEIPGEKVQIDVKVVPNYCIRGKHSSDGKKMYQWTAIDECTRMRFIYGYDEHTPENSKDFLSKFLEFFPFEIMTIQTDNGTEFTYKFISDDKKSPFEEELANQNIEHRLIKPRTPWHNGKVERSHRMDQWYFYEWETFRDMKEFNGKLVEHLNWTNDKPMRIFKGKSPLEKLDEYIWLI
jgi:transposase InsO family protein